MTNLMMSFDPIRIRGQWTIVTLVGFQFSNLQNQLDRRFFQGMILTVREL